MIELSLFRSLFRSLSWFISPFNLPPYLLICHLIRQMCLSFFQECLLTQHICLLTCDKRHLNCRFCLLTCDQRHFSAIAIYIIARLMTGHHIALSSLKSTDTTFLHRSWRKVGFDASRIVRYATSSGLAVKPLPSP